MCWVGCKNIYVVSDVYEVLGGVRVKLINKSYGMYGVDVLYSLGWVVRLISESV